MLAQILVTKGELLISLSAQKKSYNRTDSIKNGNKS